MPELFQIVFREIYTFTNVIDKNMGFSHKSHGKRSDKETQSPMLKVFKDMMQSEKNNPEKANLLKEKEEKRKRKQYSGHLMKSGKPAEHSSKRFATRSSGSDHANRDYKVFVQKNKDYDGCRTQSIAHPLHGEKRESWWVWKENNAKKSGDTYSCVSCALKGILTSQCIGICCLVFLFIASIIFAFTLVFKSAPVAYTMDDNAMNMKYQGTSEGTLGNLRRGTQLGRSRLKMDNSDNTANLETSVSHYLNGISGLSGLDFGESSLRESNGGEESERRLLGGLSSVLHANDLNDDHSSEILRNFYKKLIQTDAQIQLLKKSNDDVTLMQTNEDDAKSISDRIKRSLKSQNEKNFERKEMKKERKVDTYLTKRLKKHKRYSNDSEPTGFVVESKKLIVEYKPENIKRKFPKCSHTPNESKSHEKQLKHPFYKHTQRLDELLDKFMERNMVSDIMRDPLSLDVLFKNTKPKCQHNKTTRKDTRISEEDRKGFFGAKPKVIKNRDDTRKNDEFETVKENFEVNTELFKDLYNVTFDGKTDYEKFKVTKPVDDDIEHSITMFLNPYNTYPTKLPVVNRPYMRKLMQFDDDNDEGLGYEDLKEVLADDRETYYGEDGPVERKKRMENDLSFKKYNPPGVINPNWKSPMPLYPGEINNIIKQAAIQNLYKVETPINTKDIPSEIDKAEVDRTDTEYLEDYMNNNYDKMVKMAQAYSDYGVLENKQEQTEKSREIETTKKKEVLKKNRLFRKGILRTKKGPCKTCDEKEGFIIKFLNKGHKEELLSPFLRDMKQHIKLSTQKGKANSVTEPELNKKTSGNNDRIESESFRNVDKSMFNLNKLKRSLKSLEFDGIQEIRADLEKSDLNVDAANSDINNDKDKVIADLKAKVSDKSEVDLKNDKSEVLSKGGLVEKETDVGAAEFLQMIASFFRTLSDLSVEENYTKIANSNLNITNKLSKSNKSEVHGKITTEREYYPNYDADMIENIGHRSRVLLSVKEEHDNSSKEESEIITEKTKDISKDVGKKATVNITDIAIDKNVTLVHDGNTFKNESKRDSNKTIVKRSIPDDNLIFWNDIYDDDYGVNIDPLDVPIRAKHSTNNSDVFKRSQKWIKKKVKMVAGSLRKNAKDKMEINPDIRNGNRIRRSGDVATEVKGIDFKVQTANMKEVCREAAKAVLMTRNTIQVREGNKNSMQVESLMQQLVRLMSDLVDYQVQQKTCLKLPADLQNFLEWLLMGNEESNSELKPGMEFQYEPDLNNFGPKFEALTETSTEKVVTSGKSQCLDTISAVQDLMQQYEGMSEVDKSKMTGVKEYLENQLEYLQKQLAMEDYNMPRLYTYSFLPMRIKRNLFNTRRPKNKHRRYKFIKQFGKTSTRSTAGIRDDFVNFDLGMGKRTTIVKSQN